MVNLQPFAEPMRVEARLGDETRSIGSAWDTDEKQAAMLSALGAVDSLAEAGLFRKLAEAVWSFEMHHTDLAAWRGFVEKPTRGGVEVDQELLDEALRREDGRVVTFEEDLARLFERLDVSDPGVPATDQGVGR